MTLVKINSCKGFIISLTVETFLKTFPKHVNNCPTEKHGTKEKNVILLLKNKWKRRKLKLNRSLH